MNDRTLIIVRHAKTEPAAETDHQRRLTDRGHGDAEAGARWLADHGYVPDAIVVSSATRAQETAAILAQDLEVHDVRVDPGLYQATARDVIEACMAVEGDPQTLLIVGHNPTMADVAHELSHAATYDHLPTAGIVVLDVDGSWTQLSSERTSLVTRHTPRG